MDIKEVLRSITIYLLGAVLIFVLISLAYTLLFVNVGAKPDEVKRMLTDSDVYHKVAPVMYDEALKPNVKPGEEGVPLNNPAVRQAFLDAFDPEFVQKNFESAIDGSYGWLEGEAEQPDFVIDFTGARGDLARSLDKHLVKRTKKLPVCSQKQLNKINPDDINLFTVPCIPPGTDIKLLRAELSDSITSNKGVFGKGKIDPATFEDDNGQPLFETLKNTPEIFQTFKKLPFILAVIGILAALGIAYASKTRKDGIKRLGKLFLVSGIFVVLAPISLIVVSNLFLNSARSGSIAAELIKPLAGEINRAIAQVYILTGLFYILLAVGAFVYIKKFAPKTEKKGKE